MANERAARLPSVSAVNPDFGGKDMRFKRKAITLLAALAGITCAVGPCQVESWKVALGPVFNGDTLYGGVELEFANGFDVIVPVAPLGDNLGGGWLD